MHYITVDQLIYENNKGLRILNKLYINIQYYIFDRKDVKIKDNL